MFFHSVEFYVILTVVAAIVIGFSALPQSVGEVRQHLLGGHIFSTDNDNNDSESANPSIEFICRDDGTVLLWRRGIENVMSDGAVSIAVKVKGFDITIEERVTPGSASPRKLPKEGTYNTSIAGGSSNIRELPTQVTDATFVLDFLANERYHILYNSESTGRSAVCTLHKRPGITVRRDLHL